MFNTKYVSEQGIKNLQLYKYSGVENSLCARLFMNSFWEFVVSKVPTWIAPNLLTLSGLIFVSIAGALSMWYSPTYTEVLPSWVIFSYVILIFLYQTADNIDGKQARRTKSGSPLGELFDHGVDAIVMGFVAMMIASVIHGGGLVAIIASVLLIAAYWCSHWEEYHIGTLILGAVTGPTELQMYIMAGFIFCGFYGTDFFVHEIYGYKLSFIVHCVIALGSVGTVCLNALSICKLVVSGKSVMKITSVPEAMSQAFCHVFFLASAIMWALCTEETAVMYPAWYLFAITMGSSYMSQRLITQRICKEHIDQIFIASIPMVAAAINGVVLNKFGVGVKSVYVLIAVIVFETLLEINFAVSIIKQLSGALNIHPFKVKKDHI